MAAAAPQGHGRRVPTQGHQLTGGRWVRGQGRPQSACAAAATHFQGRGSCGTVNVGGARPGIGGRLGERWAAADLRCPWDWCITSPEYLGRSRHVKQAKVMRGWMSDFLEYLRKLGTSKIGLIPESSSFLSYRTGCFHPPQGQICNLKPSSQWGPSGSPTTLICPPRCSALEGLRCALNTRFYFIF